MHLLGVGRPLFFFFFPPTTDTVNYWMGKTKWTNHFLVSHAFKAVTRQNVFTLGAENPVLQTLPTRQSPHWAVPCTPQGSTTPFLLPAVSALLSPIMLASEIIKFDFGVCRYCKNLCLSAVINKPLLAFFFELQGCSWTTSSGCPL